MSVRDWQQVKEIFYTALTQPLAERKSFLDGACGRDESLRSEIEVLLESYESGFLEKPIVDELIPKRAQAVPHFSEGYAFSHYRVVRLLGRGGMGEVYLATDTALDRPVAIKILHGETGPDGQAAIRLLREARAAAKLEHKNICSVYEVGETEGFPFIAMQYVEGHTLDELLRADRVTFSAAIDYSRQIAAALKCAHAAGIVHGDIKPSNLIVDGVGNLYVLDFGLAKEVKDDRIEDKATDSGPVAGTIAYMSPEHLRGEDIDRRADVWSLGIVLYQMITGRPPFHGATRGEVISNVLGADFDRSITVPRHQAANLDRIFSRAMAKNRSERYGSIDELDLELAHLARKLSDSGSSRVIRNPRIIGIGVILLAVVGAFVGWQRYGPAPAGTEMLRASSGSLRIQNIFDMKRRARGAITDVAFSPDGKTLAFTLFAGRPGAIFTLPISGGKAVRLTDREVAEWSPLWSPDGSRIAFLSRSDERTMIYTIPWGGGAPVPVVHLAGVPETTILRKWSNDGTRIFFDDGHGARAVDLASGQVASVDVNGIDGELGAFSLSGDETQMLAVSNVNGTEQLWLKDLRSGHARIISESSPRNGVPSWFPGNAGYAYSSDDNGSFHIYTRPIDGSDPRQITFGNFTATHPVVSPDGKALAYVSNLDEANIFRLDIATGHQLAVTNKVNLQLFPALSPDGRRLGYQTSNETSKIIDAVLKIDTNPPSPAEIILPQTGCCLKWSPDGRQVAYMRRPTTAFELFRYEIAESREESVNSGGILMDGFSLSPFEFNFELFDWRPDGRAVVFSSKRSGKANLWQVLDDGSAEMLTDLDESSRPFGPTYSPDGRSIAFVEVVDAASSRGVKENRVLVLEGGRTTTLESFGQRVALLGWNSSGNGVFVATSDGDVRLLSVSHRPVRVVRLADVRPRSIRLSPDRQWAAYTVTRNDVDNLCVSPMRAEGEKCLTTNDDPTVFYSGITWSPDSKEVYYSRQTGGMQISLISIKNEEQK